MFAKDWSFIIGIFNGASLFYSLVFFSFIGVWESIVHEFLLISSFFCLFLSFPIKSIEPYLVPILGFQSAMCLFLNSLAQISQIEGKDLQLEV